jgi:hypothetical protein
MNWYEEENRVKLHILHSLARSQRALARILESMADVVDGSEVTAQKLAGQIDALSYYQKEIAMKMIGVRIRKLRSGVSGKPWLSSMLRKPT